MKCLHCGSWTEVLETRKADRGHTLRRTRQCANNCKRFFSYEVYGPIYKRTPNTVRQTVVAAEVRAVFFKRNMEILKRTENETHAEIALSLGIGRQAVTKIVRDMKARNK